MLLLTYSSSRLHCGNIIDVLELADALELTFLSAECIEFCVRNIEMMADMKQLKNFREVRSASDTYY